MFRFMVIAFTFVALSDACLAGVIYVPADYPTIQAGIRAAIDGDTVLVAPGTYVENIDFDGKAITLMGEQGAATTIINGNQAGSAVRFVNREDEDSKLEGFTITNGIGTQDGSLKYGGGIYCHKTSPCIVNNIITENSASLGAGICSRGTNLVYSGPLISNCTISDNNTTDPGAGGGIRFEYSNAVVENCNIENNTTEGHGGGISANSTAFSSGIPIIKNNLIDSNKAKFRGGGIGYQSADVLHAFSNTITNNEARDGAGICCYDCVVSDNLIIYNTATDSLEICGYGGGLAISGYDPIISNNIISHNTAMSQGGGIVYGAYEGIIENNIICNNTAAGGTEPTEYKCGGGIYFFMLATGSSPLVKNCLICNNYAEDYGGGVYLFYSAYTVMVNCTLAENESNFAQSIYCHKDSTISVANSIVWEKPGIQIWYETYAPDITYSDIKGSWPGTGNINSDPLFVDPSIEDFHLKYKSPCKDAGNNMAAGIPDFDFEDDPRVAEGNIDMGADEFYTHLYWTGDAEPYGDIDVKFVDIPYTAPVGLWVGTNVFEDPIQGSYGDWYLKPPFFFWGPFLPIPYPDGVEIIPGKLPQSPTPPYTLYLQAVIGNKLTNLCEMNVVE